MNKKIILWIASALAVITLITIGVFGVVNAQTPTPGAGQPNGFGMRGGMKGNMGGGMMGSTANTFLQDEVLKAFAVKLGLTVDQVTTRLKAGETHLKIAESKGITGDAYTALIKDINTKTIDAALAAGKLTPAQADELKTRYASFPLWGSDLGGKRGLIERFDFFGKGGGLKDEMLKAFAAKLGLTVDDVTARIKAGETFPKIAESKGITTEKLPAFMQDVCTQVIEAAVKAGTLTQVQADAMKAKLTDSNWSEMWGGKGMLGITPKPNQGFGGMPGKGGMMDKGGMPGKGGMLDKGGMMGKGAQPGFGDNWMHADVLSAISAKLGLTVDQINTRLQAGETLAKIAESKGITGAAFTTLVKDAQTNAIAAALAAGKITQAQADAMKAMLEKAPGMMLGGDFGRGGMMNKGGMLPFGGGRRGK